MQLQRSGHEVLSVEVQETRTQRATVKRHYTMFVHIELTLSPATPAGDITASISLVQWDTRELLTVPEEQREVTILVDGQEVVRVQTVDGTAQAVLTFVDPGSYVVEVRNDYVEPATAEVTV